MKIRAAVLEKFGEPLVVQDVDIAPPKEGEVLVKVHACGVCHTDLYTASGADPSGYCPCVLGHEGAGIVEEVGPGVTSLKKGDHVITLFSPECGECVNCKSGKTNICLAIRAQQGRERMGRRLAQVVRCVVQGRLLKFVRRLHAKCRSS